MSKVINQGTYTTKNTRLICKGFHLDIIEDSRKNTEFRLASNSGVIQAIHFSKPGLNDLINLLIQARELRVYE